MGESALQISQVVGRNPSRTGRVVRLVGSPELCPFFEREVADPLLGINAFEIADSYEATRQSPMYCRGRLDHVGLQAANLDTFVTIRDRLIGVGAADRIVADFGGKLSLFFGGTHLTGY